MSQPLLSARWHPGYAYTIRRRAGVLLALGVLELGIWLYSALRDFYTGTHAIVLQVQPTLAFDQAHQLRSHFVVTPAGGYFTGSTGDLLYQASSLGDYFLFYSLGDVTSLDALFFAGLGIYLYRALRRLPAGPAFATASRVMEVIGGLTTCMYVLKMILHVTASEIFWRKTGHLFRLAGASGTAGLPYVVFGCLLLLCASLFQRELPAQQKNEHPI